MFELQHVCITEIVSSLFLDTPLIVGNHVQCLNGSTELAVPMEGLNFGNFLNYILMLKVLLQ